MDSWVGLFSFLKEGIKQKTNIFVSLNLILFQFEANGITGKIKFDENGLRTDVSFEVVDLAADGIQKV